jgi:hypothetical protein
MFLIVETQAVDCNGGLLSSFFLPAHEASQSCYSLQHLVYSFENLL